MWMNVSCHVGRATADAKQRVTAHGTEYATIRVAIPRSHNHTDFFTFECWGKVAAAALKHVKKGEVISLRSEMRQHTWNQNGERKERVALVVRSLGIIRLGVAVTGSLPALDEDTAALHDTEPGDPRAA